MSVGFIPSSFHSLDYTEINNDMLAIRVGCILWSYVSNAKVYGYRRNALDTCTVLKIKTNMLKGVVIYIC